MVLPTTQALLNEVVDLGFDKDKALTQIDLCLDSLLPSRMPILFEILPRELYNEILYGFEVEAQANQELASENETQLKDFIAATHPEWLLE